MAHIRSGRSARPQNSKQRRPTGSMWAIVAVTTCLIIVPLFMVLTQTLVSHCTKGEQQTGADAAALAAASALSDIVVNDHHFGYVALNDAPPLGTATLAGDGGSLAITGINTLVATSRLNRILAEKLDDDTLRVLARRDANACAEASTMLEEKLQLSCRDSQSPQAQNCHGQNVYIHKLAKEAYLRSAKHTAGSKLTSFSVNIGWLDAPCSSGVPVPQPASDAAVKESSVVAGCYRAGIDIPVADSHFYFAALGPQSALVDSRYFRKPDGKHVCSVVQVVVDEVIQIDANHTAIIHSEACAEPCTRQDKSAGGRMMVHLPHGLPEGIRCLADLLHHSALTRSSAEVFTAYGGDYPGNQGSRLTKDASRNNYDNRIAALFAQGLFDWLRTNHGRVQLDSVMAMMQADLRTSFRGIDNGASLLFVVNDRGVVRAGAFGENPLREQTIRDRQLYAQSFDAISTARGTWSMKMRDQVWRLGTEEGGAHAGEALPDIGDIQDQSTSTASSVCAFGGTAADREGAIVSLNQSACDWYASFFPTDTKRKSYLTGGLAFEFELSSPMLPEAADETI